ncbi:T9SS type A sorting domain-containing protein [Flavobacterium proteolyticum]|uniref:T9SS type A sorting domain-containing protein n=1 Tax=Flavobacterium proteolyticum TaxID=2911683 RepID=A0ABR9WMZ0_9FLAO|nr:T9SS type A sorting domain-containing protein [Flavobacterium proteolyticum]MBE9575197.1 T9SS type A sorting domain-containing protein [Flavobacterium proteolyticum]
MKSFLLFLLVCSSSIFSQTIEVTPGAAGLQKPVGFVPLNGKLLFIATSTTHGRELFAFDGTTTTLVKEIASVGTYLSSNAFEAAIEDPKEFKNRTGVFNGKLFFTASDDVYNQTPNSLWSTDGTNAGTVKVFQNTFLNNIRFFKEFNGRLYFIATNPTYGQEIWSTDGTQAGTTLLKDINPGTAGSTYFQYNPNFTVFNNKLYFVANDGTTGFELYSTDGTTAGTSKVVDLDGYASTTSDRNGAFYSGSNYLYTPMKVFNNKLYFACMPYVTTYPYGYYANYTLFSTDGTSAGTSLVGDLGLATGFTVANDKLFVYARSRANAYNQGIWKVDTNGNVTYLHRCPGFYGDTGTSDDTPFNEMRNYNNELYFQGSIGDVNGNHNDKLVLYKLNPITETLSVVLNKPSTDISYFDNSFGLGFVSIVYNNQLYFMKTNSHPSYVGLSVTDGTPAGTVNVARNSSLNSSSIQSTTALTVIPKELEVYNGSMFFKGGTTLGSTGELWRLTNTALGLDDFNDKPLKVYPNPVTDKIFITANDAINEIVLFSLDGKQILKQKCNVLQYEMDLSALQSGVYLIHIQTVNQQTKTLKILKK